MTRSFAIITTAANAEIAELHDRMPVMLEAADWPVWLGEAAGDPKSPLHPSCAVCGRASPFTDMPCLVTVTRSPATAAIGLTSGSR